MNYVMYAIPFFIAAMAAEYLYGRARGNDTYRHHHTLNSLQLGTLSRLAGVLKIGIGGLVYGALTNGYTLFRLDGDAVAVWIAAFVGYDFCYYWAHRYGHQWRLLWASHVAHHQSEEFNLSTALRQTSTGYLSFVFYIPLYVLGFPAELLVSVGSLNLIYQFWVHTEHIRRLGPLEWVLVTPSNHRVHHARNPEYIDRNYGGVFILWDRLFGTFKDEDPTRPCVYGITRQLGSFNPLWANAHVYWEGLQDMVRTRHWGDKLRLWVEGPGWRPRDLRNEPKPDWRAAKYDPKVSAAIGGYCFAQYWLVTAASLTLLFADLPRTLVLASAALLAFSFYVQGAALEGRRYATQLEIARLAAVTALAWYGSSAWGAEFATGLTAYALLSLPLTLWAAAKPSANLDSAPGETPAQTARLKPAD
ncbi:MAG: sterol desaturase family protein [Pseudomonadales bacterium]